MQFAAVILATLTLALAAPTPELETRAASSGSGDMTWYEEGMGACGKTITDSAMAIAISHVDFDVGATANPNANPHCGKTVTIKYGGKTQTATVTDRCAGCAKGAIDASPALFKKFAALGAGRLKGVTWTMN